MDRSVNIAWEGKLTVPEIAFEGPINGRDVVKAVGLLQRAYMRNRAQRNKDRASATRKQALEEAAQELVDGAKALLEVETPDEPGDPPEYFPASGLSDEEEVEAQALVDEANTLEVVGTGVAVEPEVVSKPVLIDEPSEWPDGPEKHHLDEEPENE